MWIESYKMWTFSRRWQKVVWLWVEGTRGNYVDHVLWLSTLETCVILLTNVSHPNKFNKHMWSFVSAFLYWRHVFKVCPLCGMNQYIMPFYGWIIFYLWIYKIFMDFNGELAYLFISWAVDHTHWPSWVDATKPYVQATSHQHPPPTRRHWGVRVAWTAHL